MVARQERPVSMAFLSRLPFSSTGPTSRISSATSSDDWATAAFVSATALASRNSTSLAASILASRPLPPRRTRASDAAEVAASTARPVATRFLFASSMPSSETIAARTRTAASIPSTLICSPFRLSTDATVSAALPAPTSAFFSNSSTSSSER
ncbi:hypothetical protein ACQ4PT_036662 [Festuca glaucescens]